MPKRAVVDGSDFSLAPNVVHITEPVEEALLAKGLIYRCTHTHSDFDDEDHVYHLVVSPKLPRDVAWREIMKELH